MFAGIGKGTDEKANAIIGDNDMLKNVLYAFYYSFSFLLCRLLTLLLANSAWIITRGKLSGLLLDCDLNSYWTVI